MNDAQMITIGITIVAIFVGTLINNSRIGDVNNRIADVKEVFRAELQKEMAAIRHLIERNQDALVAQLARIDQRVTRLEEHRQG